MNKIYKIIIFWIVFAFCISILVVVLNVDDLFQKRIEVPRIYSSIDKDNDGVDDYSDLVKSAKNQIGVVTKYDTSYFDNGGFPPQDSGACADIVWRTFQDAGYDIKTLLETDIKNFPNKYNENFIADSNINFRRTENLRAFLNNNAQILTNNIEPWNIENLVQWQGGDIVTFAQIPGRLWHVAIVSDKRRVDGVPLLIHNHGLGVVENDYLL